MLLLLNEKNDYSPSDDLYVYFTSKSNVVTPIDFSHENIKMHNTNEELYSGKPCSLIDRSFIDDNYDKKDNNQDDTSNILFNNHDIKDNKLFFTSIKVI